MRWMLLTETYPPELNGVAVALSKLTEGLVARGHEVHIVRPQQNRNDVRVKYPANPSSTLVWKIPFPWYEGLKLGLPYFGQLRHNIKRFKPDFLHIATEGPLGLAGLLAAHAYDVPVVSSYHTNFFAYSRHYGLGFLRSIGFWYFRLLHNATLKTFVASQTSLQQLQTYKYENLDIMSRGVDAQMFAPSYRSEELRRSWGVSPEDIVMFYNGRIASEKNFPLMLECYRRLKMAHPNAKLVIAGDGPLRKKLQSENPYIIFPGPITGDERSRHYASADLFIYTSFTETFGQVVTEAMASGLKVLAYDYAAARENIVHGKNGYLANFRKEDHFLERFDELLAARETWPALAKAARETACTISWENVVAKYEQTLLSLKETDNNAR